MQLLKTVGLHLRRQLFPTDVREAIRESIEAALAVNSFFLMLRTQAAHAECAPRSLGPAQKNLRLQPAEIQAALRQPHPNFPSHEPARSRRMSAASHGS
jgi:hypothetical protein